MLVRTIVNKQITNSSGFTVSVAIFDDSGFRTKAFIVHHKDENELEHGRFFLRENVARHFHMELGKASSSKPQLETTGHSFQEFEALLKRGI